MATATTCVLLLASQQSATRKPTAAAFKEHYDWLATERLPSKVTAYLEVVPVTEKRRCAQEEWMNLELRSHLRQQNVRIVGRDDAPILCVQVIALCPGQGLPSGAFSMTCAIDAKVVGGIPGSGYMLRQHALFPCGDDRESVKFAADAFAAAVEPELQRAEQLLELLREMQKRGGHKP